VRAKDDLRHTVKGQDVRAVVGNGLELDVISAL
jgi:hypothetical protein